MAKARNILFIMFDQLRWDYLGCYGHPHLQTPNLDRLASRGVRFDRAHIQSPLCGPSRMSTYTGRYVHSHGACWNAVPLKVGERTMGDHLRDLGMSCHLIGKSPALMRGTLTPEMSHGSWTMVHDSCRLSHWHRGPRAPNIAE